VAELIVEREREKLKRAFFERVGKLRKFGRIGMICKFSLSILSFLYVDPLNSLLSL
jgi:hypothetical protein